MKEELKKIEILKKNQTEILEMETTINQIKNSLESLSKRMDQGEDRILEFKARQRNRDTQIKKKENEQVSEETKK